MNQIFAMDIRLASRDGKGAPKGDGDLALQEAKPELKQPPMYQVVMINDDYTPLAVHTQGKAVCGIYTRDIAETKAMQVNRYARENQHPLLCEIEAAGDAP